MEISMCNIWWIVVVAVVQSLSVVQLFATSWMAICQASVSLIISEFSQIHVYWIGDSIQPFHPLLPSSLPSIFPSIRVFSNESVLCIRWPKYWSFSFSNSLVAQTVKRLPAMGETRVQSLGWEDPLEKEMATHSSTLAWKTPWTEEPGRLQSVRSQRVGQDWATSLSLSNEYSGLISFMVD